MSRDRRKLDARLIAFSGLLFVLCSPSAVLAQQYNRACLTGMMTPAPAETLRSLSHATTGMRQAHRRAMLERMAFHQETADAAAAELAAMQWIERVSYHTWRVIHHLGGAEGARGLNDEAFDETDVGTPGTAANPQA